MWERVPLNIGDPIIFGLVVVLALFGVAMIFSAGELDVPSSVTGIWRKQATWLAVSLVAFAITLRIEVRWLECVQALEAVEQRGQLLRRGRWAERFTRQPAVGDSRKGHDAATVVQPKRLRRDVQPCSVHQP